MLNDYKILYKNCADIIPNWQKMTKSELAIQYIEHQDNPNIAECYLSALICKYWNLVNSFYYRQGIKQATETDCYDWIIMGITKALKQKAWMKSDNILYKDPIGPEKAMMVCIMSTRANFYQAIKHQKRCLNYTSYSIEQISENCSDGYILPYYDNYSYIAKKDVQKIVSSMIKSFDYYGAIVVDLLYTSKEYVTTQELRKQILQLEQQYITYFCNEYNTTTNFCESTIKELKQLTLKDLSAILENVKTKLLDIL